MSDLYDELDQLVRQHRCSIALSSGGETAVLPIRTELGIKVRVIDGDTILDLVEDQDTLEVVTVVEPGGGIRVRDLVHTREYVLFPDKAEGDRIESRRWTGEHPPFGVWSAETLKQFLQRPEIAAQRPYVSLDVTWNEAVVDVIRCLNALRHAAGSRVCPNLPVRS